MFVQFYDENTNGLVHFQNGLSYVWENIKNNNVWVRSGDPVSPVSSGVVYVSCWFIKDIDTVLYWKYNNPQLRIIIGGPISLQPNEQLRNKIEFLSGSAETVLFNGEIKWGLEIPVEFINKDVRYTFSLTEEILSSKYHKGCYWGKCTYCSRQVNNVKYRCANSVPIIEHPKHKYIWINARSIEPRTLKRLYPTFENRTDVTYSTYCRADSGSTKALVCAINNLKVDPKFLEFHVGIEFPSNHMLKIMNKGITKEQYLEFIKVANENKINLHFTFMLNWPEVTENDVKEVYAWLNDLTKINNNINITSVLFPLVFYCKSSRITELYKDLPKAKEKQSFRRKLWASNSSLRYQQTMEDYSYLVLDNKTRRLNNCIWEMYKKFPFKSFDDSIYAKLQYQYGMGI